MKGVIVKHMVTRLTRRKERDGKIMTLADKGGRGGQANVDNGPPFWMPYFENSPLRLIQECGAVPLKKS